MRAGSRTSSLRKRPNARLYQFRHHRVGVGSDGPTKADTVADVSHRTGNCPTCGTPWPTGTPPRAYRAIWALTAMPRETSPSCANTSAARSAEEKVIAKLVRTWTAPFSPHAGERATEELTKLDRLAEPACGNAGRPTFPGGAASRPAVARATGSGALRRSLFGRCGGGGTGADRHAASEAGPGSRGERCPERPLELREAKAALLGLPPGPQRVRGWVLTRQESCSCRTALRRAVLPAQLCCRLYDLLKSQDVDEGCLSEDPAPAQPFPGHRLPRLRRRRVCGFS